LGSAIGPFHRGMSLALLILAVELVRHSRGQERWVLSVALATLSLLALKRDPRSARRYAGLTAYLNIVLDGGRAVSKLEGVRR